MKFAAPITVFKPVLDQSLENHAQKYLAATSDEERDVIFKEMFSELETFLITRLRHWCFDASDVKDALQKTLISVATHLPEQKHTGHFRAWVKTIAYNEALGFNAARSRARILFSALDDLDESLIVGVSVRKHSLRPDEVAQMNDLKRHLKLLSPKCRQLLNLAIDGLSAREMAELLGQKEKSVGVSLSRCREVARSLYHHETQKKKH